MWQQIFMTVLGFCAGMIVAAGTVGFLNSLSILPRYADITHTKDHLLLYEDSMFAGTLFGCWFSIFSHRLWGGIFFLLTYGFFSGIFLGGWILSLEEVVDMLPVLSHRIHLKHGVPQVILSIAFGKTIGSLLFFFYRW